MRLALFLSLLSMIDACGGGTQEARQKPVAYEQSFSDAGEAMKTAAADAPPPGQEQPRTQVIKSGGIDFQSKTWSKTIVGFGPCCRALGLL
ncbi:MAG: hypothetical protein HC842_03775 [Cytophagales bacterium]|nr:hypothetical protein [Cytophagales bacterium]